MRLVATDRLDLALARGFSGTELWGPFGMAAGESSVADEWFGAIDVGGGGSGKVEEAACERAHGCRGQVCRPSRNPSMAGSRPQEDGDGLCFMAQVWVFKTAKLRSEGMLPSRPPHGSSGHWHLHLAGMCGKERRNRRNNKTLKWADSNTRLGDVGNNVHAVAANGPLCESSKACDAGSKADRTSVP
eukprot:s120_g28.t1